MPVPDNRRDNETFSEKNLSGQSKVPLENLPLHHFVHYKSHMACPDIEIWPPW
jgi:hypothetical protein